MTDRGAAEIGNAEVTDRFASLSTPLVTDACVREQAEFQIAPGGISPVRRGHRVAGRAVAVHHRGSVDVFFEAMERCARGDVLVIGNDGRLDEGCIGDLTVLEASAAGLAGIVLWGAHRDSDEVERLDWPVFSYGRYPVGPRSVRLADSPAIGETAFGGFTVRSGAMVFADGDGVLFVDSVTDIRHLLSTAEAIRATETTQAQRIMEGHSLREQLGFAEYLARRHMDPDYTFRQHLRIRSASIEE